MKLIIPKKIKEKFPWLTKRYIKDNGFSIAPGDWTENNPDIIYESCLGKFPCKKRSEVREGDIIIFENFEEDSERFLEFTWDFFNSDLFDKGLKGDLSPVGIIIHPP